MNITYDIKDLYRFIDQLVRTPTTCTAQPRLQFRSGIPKCTDYWCWLAADRLERFGVSFQKYSPMSYPSSIPVDMLTNVLISGGCPKKSTPRVSHISRAIKSTLLCRYDAKLKAYIPYAKSWMKEQVAEHIRKQLQGRRR